MTRPFFVNEEDFPALTLATAYTPGVSTEINVNEDISGIPALADGALYLLGAALSMTLVDGTYKLPMLVIAVDVTPKNMYPALCSDPASSGYTHVYPIGSVIKPYLHAQAINEILRRQLVGADSGYTTGYVDQYGASELVQINYAHSNGLTKVTNYYGGATSVVFNCINYGYPTTWFCDGDNGLKEIHHTVFNDSSTALSMTVNAMDDGENILSTETFSIPSRKCAFLTFRFCRVWATSLSASVSCGTVAHTVG